MNEGDIPFTCFMGVTVMALLFINLKFRYSEHTKKAGRKLPKSASVRPF